MHICRNIFVQTYLVIRFTPCFDIKYKVSHSYIQQYVQNNNNNNNNNIYLYQQETKK